MKKMFALGMILCLLMTASLGVAEHQGMQFSWSEVEDRVAASGWGGGMMEIDGFGLMIYVPDALQPVELTEADLASGLIASIMNADQTAGVGISYAELGTTLEELKEDMEAAEDVQNVEVVMLNGLAALSFTMPEQDTACIALVTDQGNVLEFDFAPLSDSEFFSMAMNMVYSIQPVQ